MNKKSKVVVVYPGRFQPFGIHHYKIYEHLCNKFGSGNVFISTSNKVGDDSPLSFVEKSKVISKYGIPADRVVCCESPYRPIEILSKFESNTDSVIICCGEKDLGRFQFLKKDGTASYFKKYHGQKDLNSFSNSGYIYFAPTVNMNHNGYEVCGTYLRGSVQNLNSEEFKKLFGWYDDQIHSMLKEKFSKKNISDTQLKKANNTPIMEELKKIFKKRKYTKHISHPHECADMTFNEMRSLFIDAISGSLSCLPKIDGRNLQMTMKNGKACAARNKATTISPIDEFELFSMFSSKEIADPFISGFKVVGKIMSTIDASIFKNGSTFLNFEIVHPPHNVYEYDEKSIYLHNLTTYSNGEKVKVEPVHFKIPNEIDGFKIYSNQPIKIQPFEFPNAISTLDGIRIKSGLQWSDSIDKIKSLELYDRLKILVLQVGNLLIKNYLKYNPKKSYENQVNNIIIRIENILNDIYNNNEYSNFTEKVNNEMSNLNKLGGYSAINPIEGFVFDWNGRQLKFTGSFSPVNQILGILRYRR